MMIPPETMEAAAIAAEQASKVIGFGWFGGMCVCFSTALPVIEAAGV